VTNHRDGTLSFTAGRVKGDRAHFLITPRITLSVVTAAGAPADYSFRQVRAVLALASDGGTAGQSRIVRLPKGTRPGLLSALAEFIHPQSGKRACGNPHAATPLTYVYHGKFYELRGTSVHFKPTLEVSSSRYARGLRGPTCS
jgi:hypothetical protein